MIPALKAHLFICTHRRENGASCADRGSVILRDRVKAICKANPGFDSSLHRVNASGCLGHCEAGIAAVLYPAGRSWTGLSEDSAEALAAEMISAF